MNREIKFRAWDKIDKIMREVTCYNLYDEYVRLDEDNSGNSITRKIVDVILMQFTGLLDKNGKEIYEGDIVKIGDSKWFDKDYYQTGVVTFDRYCWRFAGYIPNSSISSTSDVKNTDPICYDTYEIIGNIHENP